MKIGQRVRVILPEDEHYNKIGTIKELLVNGAVVKIGRGDYLYLATELSRS
jgi:hypothetical protein